MDYKIDKPIRLNGNHDGLYKWFIEELDPATKQLGPHYIPWAWSIHFEARNLMVVRALEFKDETATLRQHISGGLFPETTDRRAAVKFSFFGTNRTIESFTLNIVRSANGKEGVYATGSMGFEYEWDFENRMQSDSVEIEIALLAERYDALVESIADGRSIAVVTLRMVDGFYSEWSPSIRTNNVKILSSMQDQKVKVEADGIVPPVLGKVGEFSLRLITRQDDGKPLEAESDDNEISVPSPAERAPVAAPDLATLEKKLSRLATPLWIAVGLLAVSLFFH
ncbi:hypothetical protein [Rhizobium phaseoli]|uniref:hypothetical protein n=1 Tax=Rhizobium phaseoli TaxID=396 RepID=UPI0007E9CBEF|nr:hypothetical protein [Rhizobium phaseoli]